MISYPIVISPYLIGEPLLASMKAAIVSHQCQLPTNASIPVSSFASLRALSQRLVIPSESPSHRTVLVTSCNLPFSSCRLPRHRASPSASHHQSLGSTPNFPLPNRTRPFDCPYNASSWQSIHHDQGGKEVSIVILVNWH